MAAYNDENYISKAIESILNQTFSDFEFIIINDGSTDNTQKSIENYKKNDNRIVLIKKENTGLSDSLNVGIGVSKGDYIARMDADDLSDKNRLKIQVDFLDKNPDVALAGSWGYVIDQEKNETFEFKPPTDDIEIKRYLQKDNAFVHSSVMFRRKVTKKVGIYKTIRFFEDYDYWIRISGQFKLAIIPKFLVTRFEHRNIETRAYYTGITNYEIYKKRLKCQLEAVKKLPIHPKTPWYILRTMISMVLTKLRLK